MPSEQGSAMAFLWTAAFATLLSLSTGCGGGRGPGKLNSIDEVSVASSGVELREVESQLSPSRDWPGWRGPSGNGIAAAASAPIRWSDSEGVRWSTSVPGRGHGSPIVVGDRILLATAIDSQAQQLVLAYDRKSGQELWQRIVHEGNFPDRKEVHTKGTNANSTLASNGKLAFISFFNNHGVIATALDLDGKIAWQTELGPFSSKFGYAPSPLLYKSLVIFAVDSWGGGYLVGVDAESGQVAWRVARPAKNSHSSPLIANVGGRDQLLISGCDQVCSYDPATGKQLWSTAGTSETTCGTMVVSKDHVFASGGYPDKQTICLTAEGKKVWDNRVNVYEPSLLAVDDLLFGVTDSGIAYCWSATDGRERWKARLGGNFSASPTYCNGNIYVSDLSGKTYVFAANGDSYQQVSLNRLGNDSYASPAITEGEIFLRVGFGSGGERQEKLIAIGS
jgi:outer membrane protein assembly factor BamB